MTTPRLREIRRLLEIEMTAESLRRLIARGSLTNAGEASLEAEKMELTASRMRKGLFG